MEQRHAVVVANGALSWTPELVALARDATWLIAAAGGADHLARVGLRPRAVVGDLDSVATEVRAWLGEACLVPRPDQDRTDLDKTLDYTFTELGAGPVTVLGALGGRVDHQLGNLGLLAAHGRCEELVFLSPSSRLVAVAGTADLAAMPGETWSFWAFDPAVRVSVDGVHWPLDHASLALHQRPSISNRATGERVTVSAEGGAVVVARFLLPER